MHVKLADELNMHVSDVISNTLSDTLVHKVQASESYRTDHATGSNRQKLHHGKEVTSTRLSSSC